jgi:hypothetical protein
MPSGVVAPCGMEAGIDTVFMFGTDAGLFDVRNIWFTLCKSYDQEDILSATIVYNVS